MRYIREKKFSVKVKEIWETNVILKSELYLCAEVNVYSCNNNNNNNNNNARLLQLQS